MNDQVSFQLENKVAIVTGASKGIGQSIAATLAHYGAKVIVSSRKQEAVDEVAEGIKKQGYEATGVAAHMGDMDQVKTLAEKALDTYGNIDIVVNNAAANPTFGPINDTDDKVFDKIMDVNVKGPLALAKAAYPSMKANKNGSVINISSVEGITPGQGLGLYSVSKSALISLTKVLAAEWGQEGIRANVICPGLIDTKFSQALTSNPKILQHALSKQALPHLAQPNEIAGLALFLASSAASFCTGGVYIADGGYTI